MNSLEKKLQVRKVKGKTAGPDEDNREDTAAQWKFSPLIWQKRLEAKPWQEVPM
jgi:hypothetical protein